eukprot:gnl/Hemi2/146_TR37_c0_g1_i1.p1 gnl/Hemi2/146_TR37_c0_g1~~gnl/Hemi2/146_TR37_c0_g1_i1.p1  ORF type:complete len:162 (+),score=79.32 gnl/Hemi2/146_TR37_c0_g1_i1:67-486(+)
MSVNVPIDDTCLAEFLDLKNKHNAKFIIFAFTPENDRVIVTCKGDLNATHADFLGLLPEDKTRYAVYDFEYPDKDGNRRNKIIFISWCPDAVSVRPKMIHAAAKEALRSKLQVQAQPEIQATGREDVIYDAILARVNKI